jgi:predicted cobalt transporter CbtA
MRGPRYRLYPYSPSPESLALTAPAPSGLTSDAVANTISNVANVAFIGLVIYWLWPKKKKGGTAT